MGQNSVPICQFYTKHRVWQILFYRAFNLNRLFFRHSAGSFHHLPDSVIQKKYSTEWRRLGQWYEAIRHLTHPTGSATFSLEVAHGRPIQLPRDNAMDERAMPRVLGINALAE